MSTIFLERTLCCKVKTNKLIYCNTPTFLERTLCCKVKTVRFSQEELNSFLERTLRCKVKTRVVFEVKCVDSWKEHYVVKSKQVGDVVWAMKILGKNIML